VSQSERELVTALRAELAAIDPSRPCDRDAEAAGLGPELRAREGAVARLAVRLGVARTGAVTEAAAIPRTATGELEPLLTDRFDWPAKPEHCRMAFLRGLFLAHGSLSLAGGRTHLEFVVGERDAPILAAWLDGAGMPASWRIRRGRGVVTWKSGDTVGLFLRRIGAAGALLELEARQVSRALRGDLNRVLNAESANLQRAVGAAGRQIAAIEELEVDGTLQRQPYLVRLVADARRETPEATLSELAERLSVHRSAVQRALERIERLAVTSDRDGPPRARGRGDRTPERGALA
jgi:hypothetical protein